MTERPTSEQAEQWLAELVELMKELRNATTRDAGFREWRQKTLTVLQRLWPGKPTRAQRFRRVAFAPPTGVNDEALARESFEKGFAEARRLLQFWLAEIKLNGLHDHDGPIEPDDDTFTMPKAAEDAAAARVNSGLGIEKAEFPVEPVTGEDAGLVSRDLTPVAEASGSSTAPRVPTTPTRIEAPRMETAPVPLTPTRIEAPRMETAPVPVTPTRIEAPRAETAPVPVTPTRIEAPAASGNGGKHMKKDAGPKRMGEIVKFPSPPPHASPAPAKSQERPAKSAPRARNPRLKDMLGLGGDSHAEGTAPSPAPPPAPIRQIGASPSSQVTPGASSQATPSASAQATPSASAQAMPSASVQATPSTSVQVTPSTSVQATPSPSAQATPSPTAQATPNATGRPERAQAKPTPPSASRPGSGSRSAGKAGGRRPSPGTHWSTPNAPAAASSPAQAPAPTASVTPISISQTPSPATAPAPPENTETRPTVERPGELVSAHESLIEAMTGVFVTKPDLGAPNEPPIRPEVTPASPPKPAAGSSSVPGETVIAFPLVVPSVPTLVRSTPGVPEIAALAGELERLGVPPAEMGRVRDALLNLALRLGTGKVDWQLLQVGVSLVMRFPRLAARALPLLLPYFERAA